MRIVLGVGGGIAAYKAVLLLRLLAEAGHDVHVIPTTAALKFVGAATWEALAGHPVTSDVFAGTDTVDHVRIGRTADLTIIAPATADLVARAATGQADDLLTTTLLTVTTPVLMAPAMHTEMWHHPATAANITTLRQRGVRVLEPDAGRLTGSDSGPGRLPEPAEIAAAALAMTTSAAQSMAGLQVVISAGGTREPIDPVRFIGNRSSGRQGIALARAAAGAGAHVHLVAANIEPAALPAGIAITSVETTAELARVMTNEAAGADVIIMAAAVADFRPAEHAESKVKKSAEARGPTIELIQNPDILTQLAGAARPDQTIVGFAAETGDDQGSVLDYGRIKARRKGADLLAVNEVGTNAGFGDVDTKVTILDGDGNVLSDVAGTKDDAARELIGAISTWRTDRVPDRSGRS